MWTPSNNKVSEFWFFVLFLSPYQRVSTIFLPIHSDDSGNIIFPSKFIHWHRTEHNSAELESIPERR